MTDLQTLALAAVLFFAIVGLWTCISWTWDCVAHADMVAISKPFGKRLTTIAARNRLGED